jgi:hypothetical protein
MRDVNVNEKEKRESERQYTFNRLMMSAARVIVIETLVMTMMKEKKSFVNNIIFSFDAYLLSALVCVVVTLNEE